MPPTEDELRELLTRARTIAVVGLSANPDRDSHEIARYLQSVGYRVIPVNPTASEVLGERAYPSLSAIPPEIPVDIVDIFRRSEAVPGIVEEALARGVDAVWMQIGVKDPVSARKAESRGVIAVQNQCIRATHRLLGISPKSTAANR